MHVVVVGAGAVGGYFGGRLAESGTEVTFLVREGRYRQLKARGLRIHSALGDAQFAPALALSADEIEHPDVVMLAVKNYHLTGSLPVVQALAKRGARVLPLLNGVSHIETLREACGLGPVLGGSCFIEATLNAEGDVVHGNRLQEVTFGRLADAAGAPGAPDDEWLETLRAAMDRARIGVTLSQQVLVDMWQKYIFLTALSGITSATRQPIGVAVGDDVTRTFLQGLIGEMVSIATAKGVALPSGAAQAVIDRLQQVPGTMTSSMHKDLEKRLPLELDSLQGTAVAMAESAGVPSPHLQAVYALLHPYRDGNLPPYTL